MDDRRRGERDDARFIRIGRLSFRHRMTLGASLGGGGVIAILASSLPNATHVLLPEASVVAWLGISVVVTVGGVLLGLVVVALAARTLSATVDGTRVRIGRRVLESRAVRAAELRAERGSGRREVLALRLRGPHALSALVWLRSGGRALLTVEERELLESVLQVSTIEAPRSPHDPTGRFTHVNFPGALTKQEAIDVVHRSADVDAPLPLTS